VSARTRIEVLVKPGLYELQSLESSSRYYVDTRLGAAPRYLRVAGMDDSFWGRLDDLWQPLAQLVSVFPTWDGQRYLEAHEVDTEDVEAWTIRVGSRHVFTTPEPDPSRGRQYYWVKSSACKAIRALDELPEALASRLAEAERP